ncbi:MAG: hypothetical protein FJ278_24180, partial [Planctomycetes bacterium]|nr:hypothetical protein [Planctomycetota bacterium]
MATSDLKRIAYCVLRITDHGPRIAAPARLAGSLTRSRRGRLKLDELEPRIAPSSLLYHLLNLGEMGDGSWLMVNGNDDDDWAQMDGYLFTDSPPTVNHEPSTINHPSPIPHPSADFSPVIPAETPTPQNDDPETQTALDLLDDESSPEAESQSLGWFGLDGSIAQVPGSTDVFVPSPQYPIAPTPRYPITPSPHQPSVSLWSTADEDGLVFVESLALPDSASDAAGGLEAQSLESAQAVHAASQQTANEFIRSSPALFVENQGQWADSAGRYAFQGTGLSASFAEQGAVFEVLAPGAAEGEPSNAQFVVAFVAANETA